MCLVLSLVIEFCFLFHFLSHNAKLLTDWPGVSAKQKAYMKSVQAKAVFDEETG